MIKKYLIFFLLLFNLFCYAQEDDLLENFFFELGVEDNFEKSDKTEKLFINSIKIDIDGTTRESWVREKLFFKEKHLYSKKEFDRLVSFQKNYFFESKLFYSVKIYLVPDGMDGENFSSYCLCVELVDGFMQLYNFWPWDLQWGIRHLLGGEETLTFIAGYNTQAVEWSHPLVYDTPFSYYLYAGHFYGDYDYNTSINYGFLNSKIYAKFSEFAETGILADYKLYSSSLTQADFGQYIKLGGFINILPTFQIFTPLSANLYSAAGVYFPFDKNPDFFSDTKVKILFHPVSFFSMELVGILNYTDEETPFAAQPSTEEFRSAKILPRENIFYRSFLQVNFERVCVFPIKFTKVSITPYGFFEIADAQKTFKDFSVQGINYSAGGAVALYVESPVNLIFSFGAKASLFSEPAVKFHFAVNMSLY